MRRWAKKASASERSSVKSHVRLEERGVSINWHVGNLLYSFAVSLMASLQRLRILFLFTADLLSLMDAEVPRNSVSRVMVSGDEPWRV